MTPPDDAATLVVDARGDWPTSSRCGWRARCAKQPDVLLIADDPQAGREVAALAGEHGWQVEPDGATPDEGRWRVRRR